MSTETENPGTPGLTNQPSSEWPAPPKKGIRPIQHLAPGSEAHRIVLDQLLQRIQLSEQKMAMFYNRWRSLEKRVQAYITLPDYEQQLKDMNDEGKPPQVVSITVPYSFATINTIVTYMLHTFCGRKPMLQVSSYKNEDVSRAQKMELVLQYNADHTRLISQMFQWFQDMEIYGLGVLRTAWKKDYSKRTKRIVQPKFNLMGQSLGGMRVTTRERMLVYSGNVVYSQDPFMFFPDPRVPMKDVARRGEFVFWRNYDGKHIFKELMAQPDSPFMWVDSAAPKLPANQFSGDNNQSERTLKAEGSAYPAWQDGSGRSIPSAYQSDEGVVKLIPREWGLGDSTNVESWLFTILNKNQIVRAEPIDLDHGMHPVVVTEPYSFGYGFGAIGMADMLGPIQDTLSWLINSHIYNIRTALNNMFVVDPSMVEMQDLKNPDPGKLIRLKRAAYGQDVRTVLQQLQVGDVTRGHIGDLQVILKIGQILSAVTENVMGVQDGGGRKTATEVRTSGESAGSRLASHAKVISAQGVVDLTEQMSLNIQQFLDEEFYIRIVGQSGMEPQNMLIRPEDLSGDFNYPINDGTLPLDRVALLDVWKEIWIAVTKDPLLAQSYNPIKIFEYLAELGGARNIQQFKMNLDGAPPPPMMPAMGRVNMQPNEQVGEAAEKGRLVPLTKPRMPATIPQ
jgi:hypothetical protein